MIKEIIINSSESQSRIAITEDGNLVDFFVDNPENKRMVGDVYFGKVARVLPGIRAAFIDIGLKHDAFLHFSDIGDRLRSFQGILEEDDRDVEEDEEEAKPSSEKREPEKKEPEIPKLHKGEEIMVQIIKEPIGEKGVRVTSSISLPGRFCVLLPFDNKIGVSKKISEFKERKRLRRIARGILPDNCGLIIRTAAKDQTEESLMGDLRYLIKTWEDMQASIKSQTPPARVYTDLSTTISVMRDLFTPDVSKVCVDSKKLYKEIKRYVQFIQPALVEKIEPFKGPEPIFESFRIEEQIKVLFAHKVMLPSGGYIFIDRTEAMFVIDVNSGRYAAKKEQEQNSLKTDLEAAREITRQLRLRDIGGLIVIDFIDLEDDKNRKKIYDEMKKEFKRDRAKVALLPMTDFGIIQITRKRVRENILQSMNEPCPYCNGTGILTKQANLVHEIEEWLKRYRMQGKEKFLILRVHPTLGSKLREGRFSTLTKLQFRYFTRLKLETDDNMHLDKFQIISSVTAKDLTQEFS